MITIYLIFNTASLYKLIYKKTGLNLIPIVTLDYFETNCSLLRFTVFLKLLIRYYIKLSKNVMYKKYFMVFVIKKNGVLKGQRNSNFAPINEFPQGYRTFFRI